MTQPRRPNLALAIACLLLAGLAAVRAITQGMWNREHTGEGFFGYEPTQQKLTLAMAAIAAAAGIHLIVRYVRSRPS